MSPEDKPSLVDSIDLGSTSQTAQDFIDAQQELEKEAREVLPYAFDSCTKPLGPIRQLVFACLSCTPEGSTPAGICYSCSISCHGSHGDLVELFAKRNFVCDCGTDRLSKCACDLRKVQGEVSVNTNTYNQNFHNRFCLDEPYQPENEVGTMYQCLLGDVCGEDWFHDSCIMGRTSRHLSPNTIKAVSLEEHAKFSIKKTNEAGNDLEKVDIDDASSEILEGFPNEEDFEYFICWKCVSANRWLANYAGTPGFLDPIILESKQSEHSPKSTDKSLGNQATHSKKRKLEEDGTSEQTDLAHRGMLVKKRDMGQLKLNESSENEQLILADNLQCRLPADNPNLEHQQVSLFLKSNFRNQLCRCPSCIKYLRRFPCLSEEEETYEPPIDEDVVDSSVHESLLNAGEKALSTIDRIRAIEGVMAYNMLKEKVRSFLQPFAENHRVVSAEDVKAYFEELRGDTSSMTGALHNGNNVSNRKDTDDGNDKQEQEGKLGPPSSYIRLDDSSSVIKMLTDMRPFTVQDFDQAAHSSRNLVWILDARYCPRMLIPSLWHAGLTYQANTTPSAC